jgi:hypothetical protein
MNQDIERITPQISRAAFCVGCISLVRHYPLLMVVLSIHIATRSISFDASA